MEFVLSREQQSLRDEIPQFVAGQKNRGREKGLSTAEFAQAFWDEMAAKGWLGLNLARKDGGSERPYLDTAIMSEELHYHNAPEIVRIWFDVNFSIVAPLIANYGSEELRRRFLPAMCAGRLKFSVCFTDPDGGSDVGGMQTRARDSGDTFIVNGTKLYNDSQRNDWACVFVRTGTLESREKGLSVLLIDLKSPGVGIRPIPFIWGLERAELSFQDVAVPKANLVGPEGRGWDLAVEAIASDWRTISNPGQVQRSFDLFLEITTAPGYDGNPLKGAVGLERSVNELEAELKMMRLLYYHAYWCLDRGIPGVKEAAIAKVHATEFWERFYNTLQETVGQVGLLEPSPATARFPEVGLRLPVQYKFAPAMRIGGWPVETVRSFIAKEAFGYPTEIADYHIGRQGGGRSG